MLHLLGIDHKFQVVAFRPFVDDGLDEYNSRDLSCAFEQYLDRVLDGLTVTVIAEEYSHRQLERMRLTDPAIYSVAERACERRSLSAYVPFDLDQDERDNLYAAHNTNRSEGKMD